MTIPLCLLIALCRTTLVCMLTKTDEYYFCSVQKPNTRPDNDPYPDIFDDLDAFEISLCHSQTETEICEQLEEEYEPVKNSKEHTDFVLFS